MRIAVTDRYQIGQEFFRWEIATAVAGSILGINPFDQPDVEASKDQDARTHRGLREDRTLPPETPLLSRRRASRSLPMQRMPTALAKAARTHARELSQGASSRLTRHGDYCALLAYVETQRRASRARCRRCGTLMRDRKRVATCLGFGPRFLHSTGQAYKGGPNSGVFLQITCDDADDLPVPGQKYTFGVVKAAQARGDFEVLAERERRALRVHLGARCCGGLWPTLKERRPSKRSHEQH